MTRQETQKLFAGICACYPREKAFSAESPIYREAVLTWTDMLSDLTYAQVNAALRIYAADSPYPPAISDIRGIIAGKGAGDESAAWGFVKEAIRRFGSYDPQGALASMPADAAFIVQQMGWQELCLSENEEADRAHFLKLYRQHCQHKGKRDVVPENVKRELGAVMGKRLEAGK